MAVVAFCTVDAAGVLLVFTGDAGEAKWFSLFFLVPASGAVVAGGVSRKLLVAADVAQCALRFDDANGGECTGTANVTIDSIVAKLVVVARCTIG